MISDEVGLTIMNKCDFDDYVFASPHNQTDTCNNAINEANNIVGAYINNYDVILDICYPSIVEQELRLRKVVSFFLSFFFCYYYYYYLFISLTLSNSHAVILFYCKILLFNTFSAGY